MAFYRQPCDPLTGPFVTTFLSIIRTMRTVQPAAVGRSGLNLHYFMGTRPSCCSAVNAFSWPSSSATLPFLMRKTLVSEKKISLELSHRKKEITA